MAFFVGNEFRLANLRVSSTKELKVPDQLVYVIAVVNFPMMLIWAVLKVIQII